MVHVSRDVMGSDPISHLAFTILCTLIELSKQPTYRELAVVSFMISN